ncbi:phosphonoacetaldehyde hydrolase-like [Styela clava]|uniref:phosphonoacetaldehyde hydrolase-like n=1 Tax=Styela clava TaxID=7725 RepID=UPI001939AEF3|nr:phosphonoacetaldehyde hydrolase-like [Styela clava]
MESKAHMIAKLAPTSFFKRMPKRKPYQGKIKAVILDWSGTTADAHVLGPAVVFAKVFEKHGVPISMTEARTPMGIRKDLHIGQILENPDVQKRWEKVKGHKPDPEIAGSDVQTLYKDFVPMQLQCLSEYGRLIPGTAEALNYLKSQLQVKIGSTTGFTKAMVDILLREAAKQGYIPDSSIGGDEVPNNMGFRPAPFMLYQNLLNLGVWPIESVVKVDDTITGIDEGLNAGCWTVGVAAYSNYTNVDSHEQWDNMTEKEKEQRRQMSREKLMTSGAHYVVDSIAQLPLVVEEINERLKTGEQP